MKRTGGFHIPLTVVVVSFLLRCDCLFGPEECVDVPNYATVQRIGFTAADSLLSVCFVKAVSYCTPGLPYEVNRLDIELTDYADTCYRTKSENPEMYPLGRHAEVLFSGEIACDDTCRIGIPVQVPAIDMFYVRDRLGGIRIVLDTSGSHAAEFML